MRKVLFVTPICYVWRMSVSVHMNKTIKQAADMPPYMSHRNDAKIGYPNRFLSETQVGPVSTGPTIVSVRNEDADGDGLAYPAKRRRVL